MSKLTDTLKFFLSEMKINPNNHLFVCQFSNTTPYRKKALSTRSSPKIELD